MHKSLVNINAVFLVYHHVDQVVHLYQEVRQFYLVVFEERFDSLCFYLTINF